MKTITKHYDIYSFDELSESAKETAIQNFREHNLDYEWWDSVYEDAKEIGKILGIRIDDILFSGFSSQGDGACFEGYYEYEKGSVKNLKEYAPLDKELHEIALNLSKTQRKAFYQLTASVKQSGHYMHKMCTIIDVSDNWENSTFNYSDSFVETEEAISEYLRDFMHWIYRTLEKEYDYLQSDKTITETIISNEYEFTENGQLF